MAGYPWRFTLTPTTINQITVTDGSTTVTLNRTEIGKTDSGFSTSAFVETNYVSISAEGYETLQHIEVGTSNITMTQANQYFSKFSDGTNTYIVKDAEARTSIAGKQDTLVSGTNIKTINNNSLLGSGNISISTGDYDNETITQNGDNELQTVAIVNPNTNSGATSPLKIWNGTEQQWNLGELSTWHYWQTNVQAIWNQAGNLPSSIDYRNYKEIVYGNNRFAIIASTGEVIVSTDNCQTWNVLSNLPSFSSEYINDGWSNMCYGDGKFVVISNYATFIAYSTDNCQTWTLQSLNITNISAHGTALIYYLNNKFIINTDSSSMCYTSFSTDLINWSDGVRHRGNYQFMAYGNGRYIWVDYGRYWTESTDLLTWTTYNNGEYNLFSSFVAYGDEKFISLNSNTRTYISILEDYSTTWITYQKSIPIEGGSIAYGDGKFVIINYNGECCYSTDGGDTWIQTQIGTTKNNLLCYGNNMFVTKNNTTPATTSVFSLSYNKCYTDTSTPTVSSTIYSSPETSSVFTINSVTSESIILSDNNTYYYTPAGNQRTYRTLGAAHPDWLCNINNVGVKIGNTIIATAENDLLPSQSGNNGKFLSTNGTTASWETVTMPTVDQTYSASSANAQSGAAIAGAGFLKNTATGTNSITILGTSASNESSVNIGQGSSVKTFDVAIGRGATATNGGNCVSVGFFASSTSQSISIGASSKSQALRSIAIGTSAKTEANYAIQLGYGTNSEANSFYVATSDSNNYKLLGNDGKIPDDRLNTTIARTSQIPTTTSQLTNNSGFITGISWGDITGTLSSQSDLNTALNNKANDSSVVHLSGDETINGGKTFNQAFIIGTTETHPNEGGQLIFKKSHNSTMAGDVIVDQNVNNLRVIGQSTSLGIIVPFYIDCENNKVYTATPATGDNSTQVATTAFVKAQGYATTSQIPTIATTSTAGLVKPDGTTITITNDGTISASAGAYAMVIVDYTEEE